MISANKTLIILTPGFPKDEKDSTCLPFLQTFIRSLIRVDPSLQIIVLAFQYPYFSKEYVWENARVISFGGKNRGKLYRLFLWSRIRKRIKALVQQNNVIGFLSLWLGECALIGKYASNKYQLPAYCWILGQDVKKNNRYIRMIKPNPETLIALSDFLADHLQKNFKIQPQHIIPMGIDKRLFSEHLQVRDIDILGAGSLIPLKQYDIFIQIVIKLSAKRPSISAVILGEGEECERLQAMIDDNNMGNNIKLAGNTSHKEVLTFMQRSKIFLHPSSYEGFSAACAEALYAGAKLVSFTKPMNQSFKNWHVVQTEMEMLQQLNDLLEEKKTEYESVLTYDIEETAQHILRLYKP